jgi:hypothetical protein
MLLISIINYNYIRGYLRTTPFFDVQNHIRPLRGNCRLQLVASGSWNKPPADLPKEPHWDKRFQNLTKSNFYGWGNFKFMTRARSEEYVKSTDARGFKQRLV